MNKSNKIINSKASSNVLVIIVLAIVAGAFVLTFIKETTGTLENVDKMMEKEKKILSYKTSIKIDKPEYDYALNRVKGVVADSNQKGLDAYTQKKAVAEAEAKAVAEAEVKRAEAVKAVSPSLSSNNNDPATILSRLNQKGRKHAYDLEYITKIYNACGQDGHSTRLVIAVSGSETSFGTVGSPVQGYPNNYWGWGYNGSTYMNGSRQQMANAICIGFRPGGRYYTVISNGIVSRDLAVLYTGNDNADRWSRNTLTFYNSLI